MGAENNNILNTFSESDINIDNHIDTRVDELVSGLQIDNEEQIKRIKREHKR